MATRLLADCQRFTDEIVRAGGTVPDPLARLLTVAEALMTPSAAPDPLKPLLDQAADGKLDPEQIDAMIEAAANAAMIADYRCGLAPAVERSAVARWHKMLADGCADQILTSMRKTFDHHAKAVATARTLIPRETELEQWLSTAEPAAVGAWQTLPGHLAALTAIGNVAASFGTKPSARFPVIREVPGDNYATSDVALFCCSGGLVTDSAPFLAINRGHRHSAWMAAPLKLNSLSEARERYRAWCEGEWDKAHASTLVQFTNPQDGSVSEIELKNPFRQEKVDAR